MRRMLSVMAALGGLSLSLGGTAAVAGSCGLYSQPAACRPAPLPPKPVCNSQIPSAACGTSLVVLPGEPVSVDPIIVRTSQPLDYLRRVDFYGAPQVNITRVHDQGPGIELSDAPTGFTQGCTPSSTQYCRQTAPVKVASVKMASVNAAPVAAAPTVVAPQPAAPVMYRPAAQAVNMPRLQPRVYGSAGMATGPSPYVNYGSGPVMTAPVSPMPPAPMAGSQGWVKSSGPTRIGSLQATQVICRLPHGPVPVAPHPQTPVCTQPHDAMPYVRPPQMSPYAGDMFPRAKSTRYSRYGSGS